MLANKAAMRGRGSTHRLGLTMLLAAVVVALPLLAGAFGRLHPALDSIGHFRIHLAAVLAAVGPALASIPGFRLSGAAAALLGIWAIANATGLSLVPGLGRVEASHVPRNQIGAVYRLLHLNLRYDNPEPEKVLSAIGRERPDVVTLNEVSGMWAAKLRLLESAYPYRIVCAIDNQAGGVAILSLRPFAEGTAGECLEGGTFATSTIDFGGRFVEVGALHLHRPWPFDQSGQIEDLKPLLGQMAETALLAGDVNATPWSAASARIAEAAGMVAVGPSSPTWLYHRLPASLGFAGLPIDRIFAKGKVSVLAVDTLASAGSDHLPVLAEFSVGPAEDENVEPLTATALLGP